MSVKKMDSLKMGTRPISELELQRSQRESSRLFRKVTTSPFTLRGRHTYTHTHAPMPRCRG